MDFPVTVPNVNLLNGEFTDGNPQQGIPASLDPSEWSNLVTNEMLNIITSAGLTPSETANNQLGIAIQSGLLNYGADSGAANAYVVAYDPAITSLYVGQIFRFLAVHGNNGACTLNVGLGADPIVGLGGSALQGNEIPALSLVEVVYVGAAGFVLLYASTGAQQLSAGSYGVTPSQFDKSTKLSTTAFVQASGLQWSTINTMTASRTATAADVGSFVFVNATGLTYTLPTPSSIIPNYANPGSAQTITINTATFPVTISAGAGVTMLQESSVGAASVILPAGATITFIASGPSQWKAVGGSGALAGSGMFPFSKTGNGYVMFPNGIYLQWGTQTATLTAGSATSSAVTFPVAFPTAALSVSCWIETLSPTAVSTQPSSSGLTKNGFTQQYFSTTVSSNTPAGWVAIGY